MSKRRAFWILTVAGFAALGIGIWQTIRHWEWLDAHHLSGMATLDLVGLGFLAFVIPLHLRGMMDTATPVEMARDVLVRGGLMMLAFTAVFGALALIGFVLSIPARVGRPYLLIPSLLLLVPVILSFADIIRDIIQRTPGNLFWSYLRHSFELYYLLLIQLGAVLIGFALFPAGFFLQIISLVEEGIRFFGRGPFDSLPMLCEWTNVSASACTPTLLTFHVGHLALAVLGLKYGERLLDKSADWYAAGMAWLGGRIAY